jgi:hypothetical protein
VTRRLAAAALLVSAVVTTAACGTGPAGAARLNRNGVAVTLRYSPAGAGAGRLVATFRPEQAGFHLYSKDLPVAGVGGVGFPTRLVAARGVSVAGRPTADVVPVPLEVQTLGITLPVYPDGPVTLTVPVTRLGPATATVLVSYAACSRTLCLAPVVDQPVTVAVPSA